MDIQKIRLPIMIVLSLLFIFILLSNFPFKRENQGVLSITFDDGVISQYSICL